MSKIHIVDDDEAVRDSLATLLASADLPSAGYPSAENFIKNYYPEVPECLVLDLRMPGMSGLELQAELARRGWCMPIVFLSAYGDVPTTVSAMKGGAVDFLTKPVDAAQLLERVDSALERHEADYGAAQRSRATAARLESLSKREREIAELVASGLQTRDIAQKLGISHRTVETHRAHVLQKMGAASSIELVRLLTLEHHK